MSKKKGCTVKQVLTLLEKNKDERGIKHWEKIPARKLKSFGIGVTKLKKLAREIGRDHALALALWKENYFDTKLLACLVDVPQDVTKAQVKSQLRHASSWLLTHTYCQMLLSRTAFAQELAVAWTKSKDNIQRRCAYLLLYHLAKDDKKLGDDFFAPYLAVIERKLQKEENFVKDGMNNALWRIGMRSKQLNKRALSVARKIGPVEVDYGDNSCQAVDCVKHLTAPALLKKLA